MRLLAATFGTYHKLLPMATPSGMPAKPAELYRLLEAYYFNNGLYDTTERALVESGYRKDTLKPLRNPAHRVVEFHVAKLWPGPLTRAHPILTENRRIIEPLKRIWRWSNWGQKKQLAARWFALFGDMFLKIAERTGDDGQRRVFFQVLEPQYVTDFRTDERGYITAIRIDITRETWNNGLYQKFHWIEVWEKNRVRIWQRLNDQPQLSDDSLDDVDQLEPPNVLDGPNLLGFVPIVHVPFRDVGDEDDEGEGESRGMGSFTHAIDKIDEANRIVTSLHSRLFRYNKPVWALQANMMDPTGRPLPAPRIGSQAAAEDEEIDLSGEKLLRLPGMSSLQSMVPGIDYGSALAVLEAHMRELERDLPELRYYRMEELGAQSGIALRYQLADAVDRVIEARGQAESALARAHAIALSLAQALRIDGFAPGQIGTYDRGDFEHGFLERDVIPISSLERAQIFQVLTGGGAPARWAAEQAGYAAETLDDFDSQRDAEDQRDERKAEAEQERTIQAQARQQQQVRQIAEQAEQSADRDSRIVLPNGQRIA